MSEFATTILKASGVTPDTGLGAAIRGRANIFEMSQAAEASVLRPKDPGAFGHDLRAALAARVARLGGDETLASHYIGGAGDKAALGEPGARDGDHDHILDFVDKVANQTRDVATEDIASLQTAGMEDADIVRLCELVAFLAYQTRVVSGLRLMQGALP